MKPFVPATLALTLIAGCATLDYGPEPTTQAYTEPSASGLFAVRPYPNADDVCQVIGENDLTRDLLDDSAILIGCPKHEKGAIMQRVGEGGTIAAHAKHWTLISVPAR